MSAFLFRAPGPGELEQWTSTVARVLATHEAEEIWMPLGVGLHVDHQLTRDACLRVLKSKPELVRGRKVKFFEDVPYTEVWPQHAGNLVDVLRKAGARLEEDRVDIDAVMERKLHLVSIFGSQFKMTVMAGRVQRSGRLARTRSSEYGEALYEVVTPPTKIIEPQSLYLGAKQVLQMAERLRPWLDRHRSASSVTIFAPVSFGRWAEDMQLLLESFPQARIEVYVDRSRVPQTEGLTSPRIQLRVVEGGRWSWYAAAGRVVLTRPTPLVIVANPGKEHHARWLSAGCPGSDSVVTPSLNDFMLALRLAHSRALTAEPSSRDHPEDPE